MSAFPAPSYYFTGIGFNSAFYTVSTTIGLTQSQANALYLLKNTADTATALETFNSGISTNSIATTTATSNLLMYPNQTSGGIYLGVNATATIGRTGVIHIGDGNSLPSGANIHINNGTNVASNVNILNGTGSTGIINLGCATSVTNCNSNLTMATNKFITMGSNTAFPISTQVGYSTFLLSGGTLTTSTTANTNVNLGSIPIGVWIVTLSCGNGTAIGVNLSLSSTTGFSGFNTGYLPSMAYANLNAVVSLTTATTYYLVAGITTVNASIGNINVVILRIA